MIAPVPALYRGDISGIEYLFSTLGRLGLFFGGLFVLSLGWRKLAEDCSKSTLLAWLLRFLVVGPLIRNQQRLRFLQNLSLLLSAGIPAFEALEKATRGVSHPVLRARFSEAERRCREGMDVATALERCGALETPDEVALAKTGEYSGQLDRMIRHQAIQLDARLDHQYALVTEWLPRIFYLLILGYVVLG